MPPLPDHTALPEPGAEHLRRAIGQLPAHEPDAATWPRIAAQLTADADLPRLVAGLPTHEPADDLWAAIAARLDGARPAAPTPALRTRRPHPAPIWRLAGAGRRMRTLAAGLLVLALAVTGWWQLRPAAGPGAVATRVAPGPRETLTVTEETVEAAPPAATLPVDTLETQGLAFIHGGCARQPGVCRSPEFQSLHAQLTELQAQERELREASRRFGTSPELAREQTRLVNLQATVERQLINLLIS